MNTVHHHSSSTVASTGRRRVLAGRKRARAGDQYFGVTRSMHADAMIGLRRLAV